MRVGLVMRRVTALIGLVAMVAAAGRAQEPAPPPVPTDAKAQAAKAAEEWVKSNPPSRLTAQERPVVKDNREPKIPPRQREELGLPAPTWVAAHGKVQPAVREALEKQKELMADPKSMAPFQGDRPVGFQGYAYVDVYLRHERKGNYSSPENQAAIREVQKRVLNKLTAAEFSVFFEFKNTAGLVGYINEAGLNKLVDDADVVAIGLDDHVKPEDPPRALHEPGAGLDPPGKVEGKVETAVYQALEKSADGYVFVIVGVTRIPPVETVSREAYLAREAAKRGLQERVLSALTADEFRVRARAGSLSGYANRAALAKLADHQDVDGVGLNQPITFPGAVSKGKQ